MRVFQAAQTVADPSAVSVEAKPFAATARIPAGAAPQPRARVSQRASHDFARVPLYGVRLPIQTKLNISTPGDQYEQEADRIADSVMTPSATVGKISQAASIQTKLFRAELRPEDFVDSADPSTRQVTDAPAEGGETQEVQRSAEGGAAFVTGNFERSVANASGGGDALPADTREHMESRFGSDFSGVRVHHDSAGNRLARQVSARAFTLGSDIFFAPSQYRPHSTEGQHLLAHELTHVVQQADGRIGRQIQRLVSCSEYPGYDAGRNLTTYNCAGLATRLYRNIWTPADTTSAIASNFTNARTPVGNCNANEIRFWMWEYQMHGEDDLGTVWTRTSPDFHIVGGPCDSSGAAQNNVMSKNGARNVYGPASGPSWRPAARERSTTNDPSETPQNAPNGRPLFKVRTQMTESPTCAGCSP